MANLLSKRLQNVAASNLKRCKKRGCCFECAAAEWPLRVRRLRISASASNPPVKLQCTSQMMTPSMQGCQACCDLLVAETVQWCEYISFTHAIKWRSGEMVRNGEKKHMPGCHLATLAPHHHPHSLSFNIPVASLMQFRGFCISGFCNELECG